MISNFMDKVEDLIKDSLPHGSGIDGTWRCIYSKMEKIKGAKEIDTLFKFGCSYHYMDEVGYYDGWFPFQVTIRVNNLNAAEVVRIKTEKNTRIDRRAKEVQEYLDDLFFMGGSASSM